MNKILIAIPTFENVCTETFESIYNLDIPSGVKTDLKFVKSYDCAKARNIIAQKAVEGEYSHVFMIDSDVVLPKNALCELYKYGLEVILGYYPRKNEPDTSEIFKLGYGFPKENKLKINDIRNTSKEVNLIKINGGGLGCALIRTDVFTFKQMPYPYFNYVVYADGDCLSEDLYFCNLVRTCTPYNIYLNPSVGCGHVGKKVITCD